MKKIWDVSKDYIFILIAVVLIRTFIVTPAKVDGASMNYTLEDGQLVIINKFIYRFSDIKMYDVVVLRNEADNDRIIKRVIGLPGDSVLIKDGYVYVNDVKLKDKYNVETYPGLFEEEVTLGEDEYFVLGDNRGISKDSRILGLFSKKDILGRVKIRLFPFNKIGKVE